MRLATEEDIPLALMDHLTNLRALLPKRYTSHVLPLRLATEAPPLIYARTSERHHLVRLHF
jgi:hypothetical protein